MKKVLVFGMTDNPGGVESVIMNYYRNFDNKEIHLDFLCNTDTIVNEEEILNNKSKVIKICARSKNYKQYKKDMDSFGYSTGFDFYNSKNKLDNNNNNNSNALSERRMDYKDDDFKYDNNNEIKTSYKKIKRGYLLGKILPWGTPKHYEKDFNSERSKK